MSINSDIISAFDAESSITDIVGQRVYLLRLPQGDLGGPAISFSTVGDIPEHSHGQLSVCKDVTLTLNLWSKSTITIEALKQAVIAYLNAYDGELGSSYVSHASLIDAGTNYEDATQLYHNVIITNLHTRN